jgi:hypothetical protein
LLENTRGGPPLLVDYEPETIQISPFAGEYISL